MAELEGRDGSRLWVWIAGAGAALSGLLALAWITGAFASPSDGRGTCYRYSVIEAAEDAPVVACDEPHTAQMVGFLPPSVDQAVSERRCVSAVGDWIQASSRTSRARSAYRHVLVPVDAPWRKSGFRCDVVRAEYRGSPDGWVPAIVTGSAQGVLATDPVLWVQCRERRRSGAAASTDCSSSDKKVLEFGFTVKSRGKYRADVARRAATTSCRAAAQPEVAKRAEPIAVSPIDPEVWAAADRVPADCTFTTRSWKKASD